MKIAIHDREKSFSKDWIEYCEQNKIPFKLVDCYSNDIFEQMSDCDALMWHWSHTDHAAALFAKQLTYSLEQMGKKVFPDTNTCRFFDDKVGQKYLFEAMGVPHVPTYIFYDKQKALEWVETAEFPKVFKLSKGAGSANVRLVKSKNEAKKLIKTAFGKGFKTITYISTSGKRKITKAKSFEELITNLKKIPGYLLKVLKNNSLFGNQKGYIYFQNFIEGNDSDTRIVVIGNKAFVKKRFCPKGDFRASGAKIEDFDETKIDKKSIEMALKISLKMGFQSMAYDFIYKKGSPILIEMSYGFATPIYSGYYDQKLEWHKEKTEVYKEMIDNLINK